MARYYSMAEFGEGPYSGTVSFSTTANTYNTTNTRSSVNVVGSGSYFATHTFVDAASTTDIWIHGFFYITSAGSVVSGRPIIQLLNSTGTVVFRLRCTTSNLNAIQAEYWNGASYTAVGSTFAITAASRHQLDIHLVCGGSGNAAVYINKSVIASSSSMSASTDNVASVRHLDPANNTYWSELAGADFDLRDLVVVFKPATGNGNYTAWSGDYTAIDENGIDDADMISATISGDKETFTKASYTFGTGQTVDSVWIVGRVRDDGAGVVDGYFLGRSGSTDGRFGALLGPSGAFEPIARYSATDPATAAAWTTTAANSVEFGAEAA